MPLLYYRDALKRGQKEFHACLSKGEYPYLPVLEDFVSPEELLHTVDLGTIQIPLAYVRGTRTSGRTQAFARSFMPLMDEDSEFAVKWKALCQSQVEEGIREPIKAYEYMNRYYVEEGNKRVSVLKYLDADSVYAHVIRVLPRRDGSCEVELYYEFLDFCQCSRFSLIEFSKPGSYARLQNLVGKQPGEVWSDRERASFSNAYYYFHQAYEANGGGKLAVTVGDAMLAYMEVYGYPSLKGQSAAEIKKLVSNVWEEITLQQEPKPIAVKLTPEETEKTSAANFLSKVLPKGTPKVMKVAFVHDQNPQKSGWTYGHELGRARLEQAFPGEVQTTAYFNALDTDPLPILEQAIAEGNEVIFTTSPRLLPSSLRAAVEHPEVVILNCALNTPHRYIRTYYARMYEAKFICGAVAGALAGGNPVGYLCDYPIFGQVACINAFALGVQLTNPRIKVHLEWSSVGNYEAAARRLTDQGIRLISAQDIARMDNGEGHRSGTFGLSLVSENGQVNLATPVWQWGVYYEALLRRIRNRALQMEYQESRKALNYFWGMSAGVVELQCSDKLPDSTKKLAALLQNEICSGNCRPFRGPLYTQDGSKLLPEEETLTAEQILNMDWLADNIVGSIPAYEELDETGKATVGIVGVDAATKEKAN